MARVEAINAGKTKIAKKDIGKENPVQIIYSFGNLIRFNRRLLSLNLSNTGLNTQVL